MAEALTPDGFGHGAQQLRTATRIAFAVKHDDPIGLCR
jgi:hypothetical protein